MDFLTIILFTLFAVGGVLLIVFMLLGLIALLASIGKTQPNTNIDYQGVEFFDNDEPDGTNYYEVRGQTRLE